MEKYGTELLKDFFPAFRKKPPLGWEGWGPSMQKKKTKNRKTKPRDGEDVPSLEYQYPVTLLEHLSYVNRQLPLSAYVS